MSGFRGGLIALALAIVIAGGIQSAIGGGAIAVTVAVAGSLVTILTCAFLGPGKTQTWLVLFYGLGNITIALFAKTLLGQPINSFLDSPRETYLITGAAIAACIIAALFSKFTPVGRRIYPPQIDRRFLHRFATLNFTFGIMFYALNMSVINPGLHGFGGMMVFDDFAYMGIISETAYLATSSKTSRLWGWRILLMLGSTTFLAFMSNQKLRIVLPYACYFFTVYAYGRKFSKLQLVSGAIFASAFIIIVVPLVQQYRLSHIQNMTLQGKMAFVSNTIKKRALDITEPGQRSKALRQFRLLYYNYYNDYRLQPVLGRFSSVQQIDPIISATNYYGFTGTKFLFTDLERRAPSILLSPKPPYPAEFLYLQYFDIRGPSSGKFPTVPLAAEAYASLGPLGSIVIVFFTFFFLFILLKKLTPDIRRNIFGVFFLCEVPFFFSNNQNFGQYWGFMLRTVPIFVFGFWLLGALARGRYRKSIRRGQRHNETIFSDN